MRTEEKVARYTPSSRVAIFRAALGLAFVACSKASPAPAQAKTFDAPPSGGVGAEVSDASPSFEDADSEAGVEGAVDSGVGGSVESGADADAQDGAFVTTLAEAAAPYCDPMRSWSNVIEALLLLSPVARFGGVSAQGTAIAATTVDGKILVAESSAATTVDGSFVVAEASSGAFSPGNVIGSVKPADRVAINPTGDVVIAPASTHAGWVSYSRASTGWVQVDSLQFDSLVSATAGALLSEPVLGADGRSFYFLAEIGTQPPVLLESTWQPATGSWSAGVPHTEPRLTSVSATERVRPTGASADGLTLFFYDEAQHAQVGAWRVSRSEPFVQFVELTQAPAEAAPTSECDRLFGASTTSTAGMQQVVVAQ